MADNNIITKGWMDAHDAVVQEKLQPLADVQIVKTLSTAPTSSTLTYMIGNVTYDYRVGDEVRVPDANSDTGFTYYKLHDIANQEAVWQEANTGGGESDFRATIKVTLQAVVNNNVTSGTDLNGTVVSVQNITDNTAPITKQWQGNELSFTELTPLKDYTVTVAAANGYTTPSAYNITNLGLSAEESHTFQYLADEYTFSITGNQNGAVTYDNVSYNNGDTFKVPAGTIVSASDFTAAEIEGYRSTLTLSGKAVTCVYEEFTGYVDLGLPSNKLWATGNLVKDSEGNYSIGEETDWGTYASWGNIDGHNEGEGYDFSDNNYQATAGYSLTGNIASDDALHDIALARLGSPWHLPTKEDFQELYDNTDSEWAGINGVAGRKFMKKSDHSVYVFFPASDCYLGTSLSSRGMYGLYWSSSFSSDTGAYNLYFKGSSVTPQGSSFRRNGLTVRPICTITKNITITLNPTDESSVDNIQVTVTDQEGTSHSGTTDSNGVATISNVAVGSCTVKAQGKGVSPKTITVATSITSFTLDCYDQVEVTGYIIDQSDPDALPADYIVKDIPAMNSDDADDVIHRIWSNTKLYAAATSLSNGKLQVRELSRSNKAQWADGSSVTNNTTYDKFMKLPEFWWKCEEVTANSDQWEISFSMDEQSGWNHWEGNTFIGCYEAYNNSSKVYSRASQTPTASVTYTDFRNYATARGTGYSLITYEAHTIMALLGYGWLGTTDDQSIVGYGSSTYPKTTGACDSKGIYDTSANVDGGSTAGAANNGESINFWGLENWWGDLIEWVDNLKTQNTTGLVNVLSPGTSTVSRTVQSGTSGACMTKAVMGADGDMLMKAYVSDSTYSKGYTSRGYVTTAAGNVATRSRYGSYADGGLGYLSVNRSASYSAANIGSRLLFKGNWEESNSLT